MLSSKGGIIKRRVMEVVSKRIDAIQKEYDETCSRLDAECVEAQERLWQKLRHEKDEVADKLVEGVLSKIL